jgi:hypothetical protein
MSNKRERAQVRLDDFAGIVESADPLDVPPGSSQFQVNVASRRLGYMQTRRGYLPVAFEQTVIVSSLAAD